MISVTHCFCFPPRYTHFYQLSVVDFSLNGKFKPLLNMSKTQRSWATFLRLASWSVAALFLRRLPWECITIFFILSTLYTGLLFTIHNLVVSYFFCSKVCVCVCVYVYLQIVESFYPTILIMRIHWFSIYEHNHFKHNYITIANKDFLN